MTALPQRDYQPVPLPERFRRPSLKVVHPPEEVELSAASLRVATNERLNFFTHLAGFGISLLAGVLLFSQLGSLHDSWLGLSYVAYALTMCSVFGASTLSHGEYSAARRELFRTLDQVSIFLFMAATASPFLLTYCRHSFGCTLLGLTWCLALGGVATKLFVTKERIVPVWYYIALGWVPSVALLDFADDLGMVGFSLILVSGLGFMVGTWFLCNDHKAHWYHAVWHLLVIFAAACQFAAIYSVVLPAGQGLSL
jgi:hemolysin III